LRDVGYGHPWTRLARQSAYPSEKVAASTSADRPPYSVTACVHCSASTKTTIPVEETAALRDYTSAGLGA
jgi:hypothetical protein